MGTVNRVILVGNLGADAEVRATGTGAHVANFRIATTEKFKDRDGNLREETEWHRIAFWGKTAETIGRYLVKGKSVYVEGRLVSRKWTDKTGADRVTVEVRADRVVLLGGGARRDNADRDEGSAASARAARPRGSRPRSPS